MDGGISQKRYLDEKEDILDRCLAITQDIYNNINNAERLDELLSKRMDMINELTALENSTPDASKSTLPKPDADRLGNKLNLVLDLDRKAEAALTEARCKLIESMKSNTNGRKLLQYDGIGAGTGKFLDQKE
ncbi:MAG: hypothetical protein LBL49_04440 [Clostridiales Family XIII bacterium]|jgi:hypothetical protein|nr:hypothetical protein [Clostridiales Family XIII bacterium]